MEDKEEEIKRMLETREEMNEENTNLKRHMEMLGNLVGNNRVGLSDTVKRYVPENKGGSEGSDPVRIGGVVA